MSNILKLKLSLYLNYFVFAILLNSVGVVILKSIMNYGVDEVKASTLELFKDVPIAIVSFLVASFIPKVGYKKAMLFGLGIVVIGCLIMYFGNSFATARLLFAMVGIAFALIKVSVYSVIGMVTHSEQEHSSMMNTIEGIFMFGIAMAYFLFPAFNNDAISDSWLDVYWLLAALSLTSFIFLWATPFDFETKTIETSKVEFGPMFGLMIKKFVLVFLASAFLYVMIEQGIMTWLPTFNKEVIKLSTNVSIMMASILAVSLGMGRIIAGFLSNKLKPIYLLVGCIVTAMLLVVFVMPEVAKLPAVAIEINQLNKIPLVAFAFPLVGLFIAPIYPLLNSSVLNSLPSSIHAQMTGLIVIFSALGGTIGSRIMGYTFKTFGAQNGFYFTIVPFTLLIITVLVLERLKKDK